MRELRRPCWLASPWLSSTYTASPMLVLLTSLTRWRGCPRGSCSSSRCSLLLVVFCVVPCCLCSLCWLLLLLFAPPCRCTMLRVRRFPPPCSPSFRVPVRDSGLPLRRCLRLSPRRSPDVLSVCLPRMPAFAAPLASRASRACTLPNVRRRSRACMQAKIIPSLRTSATARV